MVSDSPSLRTTCRLFNFHTAREVQGECRVELARAMLSRSLHSPMHLKCIGKGTTFCSRFQENQPYRVSQNHADEK